MHRRARHLNPGSAGAVLALDSRFITGLSDGDPVSTWSDRSSSANNATGSGTARPTYQTNEINGNPCIRFDGTNDVFSLGTSAGLQPSTLSSIFVMVRRSDWSSANFGLIWCKPNANYAGNGYYITIEANTSNKIVAAPNTGTPNADTTSVVNSRFPLDAAVIFNVGITTQGAEFFANGSSFFSVVRSQSITSTADTKYLGDNSPGYGGGHYPGDFAQVIISSNLAASLRRRLEHAAAFSFKIPCS